MLCLLPNQQCQRIARKLSVVIHGVGVQLRLIMQSIAALHSVCIYSRQWIQSSLVRVVWIRRRQPVGGVAAICGPRCGHVWRSKLSRPSNISATLCPSRCVVWLFGTDLGIEGSFLLLFMRMMMMTTTMINHVYGAVIVVHPLTEPTSVGCGQCGRL